MKKFDWFCDVIDLYHFETIPYASIQKSTVNFPFVFGKGTCEMPLEKVKNIFEPTIFKSVFLLFVPSIENGTNQIISFFSLHHIIHYLATILPHEIPNW